MKTLSLGLTAFLLLTLSCKRQEKAIKIIPQHRCANCNMIVDNYPNWVHKAVSSAGDTLYFDGARCMFKIILEQEPQANPVLVRDYYTLKYIDGRKAFYVIGSDALGPMGNELIPFAEKSAAETFLKEHNGERIVKFEEVDLRLVMKLAKGMQM